MPRQRTVPRPAKVCPKSGASKCTVSGTQTCAGHKPVWRVRWDSGARSATFATRTEASDFAAELYANGFRDPRLDAGGSGGMTFEQAAEKYLASLSVKSGTLVDYRRQLRKHVYPKIGRRAVADVRPSDLEAVFVPLADRPALAVRIKACLVQPVFGWAIAHEHRTRANPADVLRQGRGLTKYTPDNDAFIELCDIPVVLECAYEVCEDAGDLCAVLIGTGERWQEGAALKVSAVSWKDEVVRVQRVARRGGESGSRHIVAEGSAKSANGLREIPIPHAPDDRLREVLLKRTEGKEPGDWLFPGRSVRWRANHVSYDVVQAEWMPAITALVNARGIGVKITTRVLRRSFATAIRDRGMPEADRKLVLGHRSETGATAHYTKLTPQQVANLRPYLEGLCARSEKDQQAAFVKAQHRNGLRAA
jgi:integrase